MKNLLLICAMILCAFTSIYSQQSEPANTPSIHQNVVQFTILPGSQKVGAGLKYKSLYQLAPVMHLGWGAGLESYDASVNKSFLPITAEVMGDLSTSSKTPFYTLGVGYAIPLAEEDSFAESVRGGLTYDVAFGYRIKSSGIQPIVSLGYRAVHAKYLGEDQSGDDNKSVTYKRWSVSVGVIF